VYEEKLSTKKVKPRAPTIVPIKQVIKELNTTSSPLIVDKVKKKNNNPLNSQGSYSSSSMSEAESNISPQKYLNDYEKKCRFRKPDPVFIMMTLMNDLMILLKNCKKEGVNMFKKARSASIFESIKMQIASFTDPQFLIKSEGENWLIKDEEKLSFFMNFHNFAVLFALCKCESIPNTQTEWNNLKASSFFKVGNHLFTISEIEHCVLRAEMLNPNIPNLYLNKKEMFSKFSIEDPRHSFRHEKKEEFISFGLYMPTKSSPSLRIYKPDTLKSELKDNCSRYLEKNTKIGPDKGTLIVPEMIGWYSEDYMKIGDMDSSIVFIKNHLPVTSDKLIKALDKNKIDKIQYENYNWSFYYDAIEERPKKK